MAHYLDSQRILSQTSIRISFGYLILFNIPWKISLGFFSKALHINLTLAFCFSNLSFLFFSTANPSFPKLLSCYSVATHKLLTWPACPISSLSLLLNCIHFSH